MNRACLFSELLEGRREAFERLERLVAEVGDNVGDRAVAGLLAFSGFGGRKERRAELGGGEAWPPAADPLGEPRQLVAARGG